MIFELVNFKQLSECMSDYIEWSVCLCRLNRCCGFPEQSASASLKSYKNHFNMFVFVFIRRRLFLPIPLLLLVTSLFCFLFFFVIIVLSSKPQPHAASYLVEIFFSPLHFCTWIFGCFIPQSKCLIFITTRKKYL